jgi:hypothetical protein
MAVFIFDKRLIVQYNKRALINLGGDNFNALERIGMQHMDVYIINE